MAVAMVVIVIKTMDRATAVARTEADRHRATARAPLPPLLHIKNRTKQLSLNLLKLNLKLFLIHKFSVFMSSVSIFIHGTCIKNYFRLINKIASVQ